MDRISSSWRSVLASLIGHAILTSMPVTNAAPVSTQNSGNPLVLEQTIPESATPNRIGFEQGLLKLERIELDPFNEYVPDTQLSGYMALKPYAELPYARLPYIRRGDIDKNFQNRANFALPPVLYVDLAASGTFTFTDNVLRSATNRQSDLIVQAVLTIDTQFQITDDLKFVMSGNIAYYRAMDNEEISGFGFSDSFYLNDQFKFYDGLTLGGNLLFHTQLRWTKNWGDWDLELDERFTVSDRIMQNPYAADQFSRTKEAANLASIGIGRVLPAQIRFGLAYVNAIYFYNADFNLWDRQENRINATLSLERNTARFKPFFSYDVRNVNYTEDNTRDGWIHEMNLGARGPVTDNLFFEVSAGYGWISSDNQNTGDLLWRMTFDHLMNSKTRHQFLAEQDYEASASTTQAKSTTFQYKIGRDLGRLYVFWLGGKTQYYDPKLESQNDNMRNWGVLADFDMDIAKNMSGKLTYQYINWSSDSDDKNFYENRVSLSLIWNI